MRQDHSPREGRFPRVTTCTRVTWPCTWPPLLRHTQTSTGGGSLERQTQVPGHWTLRVEGSRDRAAGSGGVFRCSLECGSLLEWKMNNTLAIHDRGGRTRGGSQCSLHFLYKMGWTKEPEEENNVTFSLNARDGAKSLQSCSTLYDPVDCSPPGSSVHGILQARTLEWVAMPSSRESL